MIKKQALIFFFLYSSLLLTSTASIAALDDGLVSYWKFDEGVGAVVNDSSGGLTGNIINNPAWQPGVVNNGLVFDGVDDYVAGVNSSTYDLTDQFSLVSWVKFATDHESHISHTIISKWTDPSNRQFIFRILSDTGVAMVSVFGDATDNLNRIDGYSGTDLRDDMWHHVVAVMDFNQVGLNRVKIYIDGVLDTVRVIEGLAENKGDRGIYF